MSKLYFRVGYSTTGKKIEFVIHKVPVTIIGQYKQVSNPKDNQQAIETIEIWGLNDIKNNDV